MRKVLLSMACLTTLNVSAQKIDFDAAGKTGDAKHTEQGFWGWDVARAAADTLPKMKDGVPQWKNNSVGGEKLPDGMQIIVTNASYDAATAADGYYGVAGTWGGGKKVESNPLSKIPDDFVCTTWIDTNNNMADPADFTTIRFIIKGMKPGVHTLLAYHSASNHSTQPAMVKAQVNGVDACEPVQMSTFDGTNWQGVDDIAQTFVSFTAIEGQDVVVDYVPVPVDGVEYTNKRVYVNAIVFDAIDPNMKVTNMMPLNNSLHIDAPDRSVTLSWTGAASAASHRVMLGTAADAMQEVQNSTAESYTATGLSPLNVYYWRVDEVPAAGEPVEGEAFAFRINQLAFPGAEGYGRYAYGGRGGQVVHVTSLEDDGTEGTLRHALEQVTGPRTVVFDVSGIITLTKPITVNESYVTIAGQTAPGDGILIRGGYLYLGGESITRFIRHRMGFVINTEKGSGYSGMTIQGRSNAIVDHASVGWATAETFKSAGNFTEAVTIQNTIIAEALTNGMPGEDGFGYGFEAGGESGSYHHNLMAHNYYGNPAIAGGQNPANQWLGQEEYYNNVAYNWGSAAAAGSATKINFAGNYYKAGPASTAKERVLSINVPKSGTGSIDYYVEGNLLDVNGTITDNPYSVNTAKDEDGNPIEGAYEPVKSDSKVVDNGAEYETALTAYAHVLSEAGASLKRDKTDQRIINDVRNGTATFETAEGGMIANIEDSDYDLYENVSRADDFDANQNGIADWYEKAMNIADAQADPDGDGYTNLEDYLNYMAMPNVIAGKGQTVSFELGDYFAGFPNGTTFEVLGAGSISGTTLTVTPTDSDQGFLQSNVTARNGEVSLTRQFNVYVSGTVSGIGSVSNATAKVDSYELFNAAGVLVLQGKADGTPVDRLPLNVSTGVYILKVKDTEGHSRTFSVLKK